MNSGSLQKKKLCILDDFGNKIIFYPVFLLETTKPLTCPTKKTHCVETETSRVYLGHPEKRDIFCAAASMIHTATSLPYGREKSRN